MSQIANGLKRRRIPLIFLVGVMVLAFFAGSYLSRRAAKAAENQPVAYSHSVHIEAGMNCLYCHSGANRAPIAGAPSVQKCMGCHEVIAPENEEVQIVADYWQRGEPIPWERVNHQPDFVYFSHQPHVNSGLACENCHGEVSTMDLAEPVVEMDMGWCLDCHAQQHEDIAPHLWDCLVCHK